MCVKCGKEDFQETFLSNYKLRENRCIKGIVYLWWLINFGPFILIFH